MRYISASAHIRLCEHLKHINNTESEAPLNSDTEIDELNKQLCEQLQQLTELYDNYQKRIHELEQITEVYHYIENQARVSLRKQQIRLHPKGK
jgi:hypothetical protein